MEESIHSDGSNEGGSPTAAIDICRSEGSSFVSTPPRGLEHCNTAPVHGAEDLLIVSHEATLSRSKTEKRETPKHEFKLDRLSDREKKNIIVNLVKIQNNGTVEFDVERSAPVASELLELDAVDDKVEDTVETLAGSGKSVPKLKIVILVVGTRGDVQPFLAIAKRLQASGIDFYPLGGDPKVLAGYMVRNKGFLPSGPGEIFVQRKQLKAIIDSLLPACTEPDLDSGAQFRAQAIIANPPSLGHAHIAEALGIPLHIFFTMPWTYLIFEFDCIVLPALISYCGIANLVGYWGILVDVVGFCFLNLGAKYEPRKELFDWIQQGPKPIYIGFGSMPLEDTENTMHIILESLKDTGQRGIIDRGWGDLGMLLEASDNIFLIEDCPHDWLFPQCAAVCNVNLQLFSAFRCDGLLKSGSSIADIVHHGGAGTTATGLRAGCPTTIVPFFGDQFFWGDRIHERGLGPPPIPISKLSVEGLTNAIRFMLQPERDLYQLGVAFRVGKS
ncbi:hypothetical protein Syun_013776 [Stephania yunnanensis]|uniref:Glycosyltransferase family 28 N-terminal domain-containing protein n=1 Tax=Stephania yunnanensis TaxID=152371 RepID=A0AAP0JJ50_9MAGN